jgi:hypothetical protein
MKMNSPDKMTSKVFVLTKEEIQIQNAFERRRTFFWQMKFYSIFFMLHHIHRVQGPSLPFYPRGKNVRCFLCDPRILDDNKITDLIVPSMKCGILSITRSPE